jgi:multisubunit Na+/H+ antiporter MnhB subunit
MTEGVRQPDWVGRGIGLAVFAGGIVLLILVFVWSNQLMALAPAAGQKLDWVEWSVRFGIRIASLFVMGLVASWIAGRGAQLYGAANRALSGD